MRLFPDGPSRAGSRPRPDPNVVGRRMGQEFVLIHLQTNRVYALNRTGARLWELLGAGCDRDQLRERMAREFHVSDATLAGEIERLLKSLVAEDLVSVSAEEVTDGVGQYRAE